MRIRQHNALIIVIGGATGSNLVVPNDTRPSRQLERPEWQYGSVAKCVAGTIVDELCELGRGENVRDDPRGATCSDRDGRGLVGLA